MRTSFRRLSLSGVALALGMGGILLADVPGSHSQSISGSVFSYVVAAGDSLSSIGARVGVDRAVLARANGIPPNARLRAGDTLIVDNRHVVPPREPHETVLINIPQRMLFRFEADRLAAAHPVAVGRPTWPTPEGPFTITAKEADPCWDVPLSIQEELRRAGKPAPTRVPPGPTNPLGAHWLRTSLPSIGLHGTPAPLSIYRAVTHGCIRLHPDDAAALFEHVPVGAAGRFVYAPVLLARTDAGVFLEVNHDIYGRAGAAGEHLVRALARQAGLIEAIDWDTVRRVLAARDGVARYVGGNHGGRGTLGNHVE